MGGLAPFGPASHEHLSRLLGEVFSAQRDMATDWIAAYKKYFNTDRPLHAYSSRDGDDGPSVGVIPDLTFELPTPRSDDVER